MITAELVDGACRTMVVMWPSPIVARISAIPAGTVCTATAATPCYDSSTGEHSWVVYAGHAEAWLAEHPEAREMSDDVSTETDSAN